MLYIVERCKHVKSQATAMYLFQARQAKASIYICTHVWGIIGHVTVEAGNTVGTDGAPPQFHKSSLKEASRRLF